MPKRIEPLSPSTVANAKAKGEPYKLRDGRGLYVLVNSSGSKLWRFEYRRPVNGKRNALSLGEYPHVSLKRAREKCGESRRLLADCVDPGAHRKGEAMARAERAANSFEAIAREWLAIKAQDWVTANTAKETLRLDKHAFPWIGGKPIAEVTVDDVRPLLSRVVATGHIEQAHRLREQLSRVFRFAVATGRAKADPAHALSEMLPSRSKKGFPSVVKADEIGELLRAMEGFKGTLPVACALRLAPLWFARPGEIRMAEWTHFDLDGEHPEYRVPPSNRKLRKADKENPDTEPHIIPLSVQALEILRELRPLTGHRRYLFPGARDPNRCMSEAAVNAALARIGYKGKMVGHGFRHMAKTRLQDMGFPREVVEAQLSHKIPGVEGKYWREQYLRSLPQRRKMMQAWADYLDALREHKNVVPIRAAR